MFGDPDFFDISTLKQMSMWPSEKMVSKELVPYLRRMKMNEIKVLEVGIKKGENAVDLYDRCDRIKFYGIEQNEKYKEVLNKNISQQNYFSMIDNVDNDVFDAIIFDGDCNLEIMFEKYYNNLRKGGIICGNDHDKMHVKAAIMTFRRRNKISAPIHIASGTIWFWYKP